MSLGDIDTGALVLLGLTLVVGATVQGLVGLGLGLVAAPVAMLLEPGLMPDLLLWLAMFLPVAMLAREHAEIDWPGLGWSLAARVPGTVVGVALVATFSTASLGVAVAVIVLLSVLLTARAVVLPVTRATLVGAGFTSGITGTASSIGGPPLTILLQHRSPRQIRTTLAVYFLVGGAMSLVGLAVGGRLELHSFVVALLLAPCLFVGLGLARALQGVVPSDRIRAVILVVCAASATVLLARSVL